MANTNIAVIVSIIVGGIISRSVRAQFLVPGHSAGTFVQQQPLAHDAVVLNAHMEDELPSELHRSDRFYKNPNIAAGLARESWLTDKEMPVYERAADKIPRSEIYKLVKSAGFIRRRRFLYA